MALPKVGTVIKRKKSNWPSARAAWADIAEKRGVHPASKFKLKRMDSATEYRWEFLGRK